MPEHERDADSGQAADGGGHARVLIVVVRTGGFAGISRRWRVEPEPAEEPRWTLLVERCPWDAPRPPSDPGADRFTWTVHARTPEADLQRELPESAVTGAWRELVEAVREAGDRGPQPSDPEASGPGASGPGAGAPGRGPHPEPDGPGD